MTPIPDRLSNPYAVPEEPTLGSRSARRAARALAVGALGLGAAGAFAGAASAQEVPDEEIQLVEPDGGTGDTRPGEFVPGEFVPEEEPTDPDGGGPSTGLVVESDELFVDDAEERPLPLIVEDEDEDGQLQDEGWTGWQGPGAPEDDAEAAEFLQQAEDAVDRLVDEDGTPQPFTPGDEPSLQLQPYTGPLPDPDAAPEGTLLPFQLDESSAEPLDGSEGRSFIDGTVSDSGPMPLDLRSGPVLLASAEGAGTGDGEPLGLVGGTGDVLDRTAELISRDEPVPSLLNAEGLAQTYTLSPQERANTLAEQRQVQAGEERPELRDGRLNQTPTLRSSPGITVQGPGFSTEKARVQFDPAAGVFDIDNIQAQLGQLRLADGAEIPILGEDGNRIGVFNTSTNTVLTVNPTVLNAELGRESGPDGNTSPNNLRVTTENSLSATLGTRAPREAPTGTQSSRYDFVTGTVGVNGAATVFDTTTPDGGNVAVTGTVNPFASIAAGAGRDDPLSAAFVNGRLRAGPTVTFAPTGTATTLDVSGNLGAGFRVGERLDPAREIADGAGASLAGNLTVAGTLRSGENGTTTSVDGGAGLGLTLQETQPRLDALARVDAGVQGSATSTPTGSASSLTAYVSADGRVYLGPPGGFRVGAEGAARVETPLIGDGAATASGNLDLRAEVPIGRSTVNFGPGVEFRSGEGVSPRIGARAEIPIGSALVKPNLGVTLGDDTGVRFGVEIVPGGAAPNRTPDRSTATTPAPQLPSTALPEQPVRTTPSLTTPVPTGDLSVGSRVQPTPDTTSLGLDLSRPLIGPESSTTVPPMTQVPQQVDLGGPTGIGSTPAVSSLPTEVAELRTLVETPIAPVVEAPVVPVEAPVAPVVEAPAVPVLSTTPVPVLDTFVPTPSPVFADPIAPTFAAPTVVTPSFTAPLDFAPVTPSVDSSAFTGGLGSFSVASVPSFGGGFGF